MEISQKRLEVLEDIEDKMLALEGGGVDNWENYEDSLEEYWAKKEEKEAINTKFDEILECLCGGIIEPAGHGCGFGFTEEVQTAAFKIFKEKVK